MKPAEKQVEDLLLLRDYCELNRLNREDRRIWQILQSNLYRLDGEILRWRSIEAIAALLCVRWDSGERERVLNYLRTLVWSMNDESGGIGWSSAQTIAEAVVAIPDLHDPFVSIMVHRAFTEPVLTKSGLWAIGRLGQRARQSVELFQELVLSSFKFNEPQILGLASWALGQVRFDPSLPYLQTLRHRQETVRIYISPGFSEKPLGVWVQEAMARLAPQVADQE